MEISTRTVHAGGRSVPNASFDEGESLLQPPLSPWGAAAIAQAIIDFATTPEASREAVAVVGFHPGCNAGNRVPVFVVSSGNGFVIVGAVSRLLISNCRLGIDLLRNRKSCGRVIRSHGLLPHGMPNRPFA
jgi:hypothetical protein